MKTGNLTLVYGAVAMLSVLLLIGYLLLEKKKERNFLFLIACVAAVNSGYYLLAAANTLRLAMVANAISYFGHLRCVPDEEAPLGPFGVNRTQYGSFPAGSQR